MKRSDMIKVMRIASATGPSANDINKYLANILSAMEKAGMTPPKVEIEIPEKHEGFGGTTTFTKYEWEDESTTD